MGGARHSSQHLRGKDKRPFAHSVYLSSQELVDHITGIQQKGQSTKSRY